MDLSSTNADAEAAQRLSDRQEIADLCVRYTAALDTKDWALLESCFAPFPVFVHPGGRLEGFPAILERTKAALTPLTATQPRHAVRRSPGGGSHEQVDRAAKALA